MSFLLGAALGLMAGTFLGVLVTCILVASRREPASVPAEPAEAFTVVRWDTRETGPARAPGRNG